MSGFGIFFLSDLEVKIEIAAFWKLFLLRGISGVWDLQCFVHSEDQKTIHSSHGSKAPLEVIKFPEAMLMSSPRGKKMHKIFQVNIGHLQESET